MQNFDQGRFNYHQIQFVVDALIKMKENPLVIIPFKYGFDSFTITTGVVGEMQKLTDKERAIRDSLMEKGMLYRVPPRLLDDYYWMMASVSDQTVSPETVSTLTSLPRTRKDDGLEHVLCS